MQAFLAIDVRTLLPNSFLMFSNNTSVVLTLPRPRPEFHLSFDSCEELSHIRTCLDALVYFCFTKQSLSEYEPANGGTQQLQALRFFHSISCLKGSIDVLIPTSGRRAMIAERFEQIHLMQYRRGEYILNRLRAQTAVNKVVSLTYRGVTYEKLL